MVWYLLSTLVFGFVGFGVYLYGFKKGMFDDLEDVKYQMFRDEEQGEE